MKHFERMIKEPVTDTMKGLQAMKVAQIEDTLKELGLDQGVFVLPSCTTMQDALMFKKLSVSGMGRYIVQMQRQVHYQVLMSLGQRVPLDYQKEDIDLVFKAIDRLTQECPCICKACQSKIG